MALSISSVFAVMLSLFVSVASAAPQKAALLDPVLRQQIKLSNEKELMNAPIFPMSVARPGEQVTPFAEYEEAGYLVFNGTYDFNSFNAKREMVKNLPSGVQVIIISDTNDSGRNRIRDQFKDIIDPQRLHVVFVPGARGAFWARDSLPIPLHVVKADGTQELRVVDARYYHGFASDQYIADLLGASLVKHNMYFEGGNFMASRTGACMSINNDLTYNFPDSFYTDNYGCKELHRLPFTKGIGHVDETIRFINDKTVLTDEPKIVPEFEKAGYRVVMLPRPDREYETYVNSLLINNTMYVPIFNEANDQKVIDIYKAEGFKVVPIPTVELSNDGLGSIHCITMTYPKVPLHEVLMHLGAKPM